jgi:raffinose/stachyose/melibiose transport system permease protein
MKADHVLRGTNTVLMYALLGFLTFLTLFPLFWMLNNSLKTNTEIFQNIFALPTALHFENYAQAWTIGRLGPQFVNSVVYTVSSTVLILLLSSMMGFAFGKLPFRRSTKFLYGVLGLGILISLQAILIPLFILIRTLGMQDSHLGIVLVYTALGLPIPVFLTTEFMKGVPDSLLESARIDGAGNLRILWSLVMPLLAPVLTTIAILNVLGVWNEFMLVLVLGNDKTNSISVGVYSFSSVTSQRYDRQLAALVIAVFPVICAYLAFNKLITQGVVAGAVKG